MTTAVAPQFVKALFLSLVKAAGGVEPSAVALGVSHQRISQLTGLQSADMPTLMHVIALERFAGQAIVTGALAKLANPDTAARDPLKETSEVVSAASELLNIVVSGGSRREVLAAVAKLQAETADVPAALAEEA